MKLLAVDVGNTEIKRAIIDNGVIGPVKRDPTKEIARVVQEIGFGQLPVGLCSVRKAATEQIKNVLSEKKIELICEVNDAVRNPVSGFYEGMGADRIAEIAAAWVKHDGKPVLVVGLGTATTCSAASRAGIFKGGFITLGIGALCATLTEALPELPTIDPKNARSVEPGFDTYGSICRGTLSAHVGIVEEWIRMFREEIGDDLVAIATGGWSESIAPYCRSIDETDPLLTLRGIWEITKAT